MKRYETYSSSDFIQDDFFLKWVKDNNAEATLFWEKWIKLHPEKQNDVEVAKHTIKNLQYKVSYSLTDEEYTQVFENILRSNSKTSSKKSTYNISNLKYAAVLIPLVIAIYFLSSDFLKVSTLEKPSVEINYEERYYPNGKKATLKLSDSTKININADSKIKFPKNFNGLASREIYLEGEAFFDVKRDTLKPFKVHTGILTTEVLGTSFNVDANPKLDIVQITVSSGKVAVYDKTGNRIILMPGEYVIYDKKDNTFSKHSSKNLEKIIGWTQGKLFFDNEPIEEVFKVLERWYGVEFIGEEDVSGVYTGMFENTSLEKVLDGIGYTSNFNYKIKGKLIYIN